MDHEFKMLVNGALVAGASSFEVINPATEEAFATCPKADEGQLNAAVAAAEAAFPAWASLDIEQRAAALDALATELEERAGEFAALLTREQGKPLDQAMGELIGCTFVLRYFRDQRIGDKILRDEGGNRIVEHRTPLGVVAAITPWNFPMILLMHKVGPALIAGNTVVAKPAPTTPLTTLLFGELCARQRSGSVPAR